MLWIALYLPELSLQIAERGMEQDAALVVSAGPEQRPQVFALNEVAKNAGIHAGMTVAAARALTAELRIVPRNEAAEREAVENYACWACQFTPAVSLKDAEGLLLEVSTTLSLHKSLRALVGKLRGGTHELGYRAVSGIAPTPLAAWLFAKARYHGYRAPPCLDSVDLVQRLPRLPLALLDWPEFTTSTLAALGLVRISDFLALPEEGANLRFGGTRWQDLQRALGRLPDPRLYFRPPESFRSGADFGFEVNDALALLFPLKRLLTELEGFLRARGAGIMECHLRLDHSDHQTTEVLIGVGRPERSADRLLALAREHLTRLELPATVLAIAIRVDNLHPFAEVSGSWLPDPEEKADSWFQLLDKLTARLGIGNVHRIQAVDDYRPENAWRTIGPTVPLKGYQPVDIGLQRPLFLLNVPRLLHVNQGVPLYHGEVEMIAGPERIECGWWDGKPTGRDYFIGRNSHGETLWLYREFNDYRTWHLHGYFS